MSNVATQLLEDVSKYVTEAVRNLLPEIGERVRQEAHAAARTAVAELLPDLCTTTARALQDDWLDSKGAAKFWYGREGMGGAWRALRSREPRIDEKSIGDGHLRRWRKSDLEALLRELPQTRQTRQRKERG